MNMNRNANGNRTLMVSDINADFSINVLDILIIVNMIIG